MAIDQSTATNDTRDPTRLLDAAKELGPVLRDNVQLGERDRQLPDATAAALRDSGVFQMCRPQALGGFEADPLVVLEVVEELARHDASAAWCAANSGIVAALEAFTPQPGVVDRAASDVVNGLINPTGRAVVAPGGYRVSGRWAFASNCHHCDWLAPSSIVFEGDSMASGPEGPTIVMTWVPASEWQIVDTWDTCGLRGTGSHDIEVSDVFVPADRAISLPFEPRIDGALFRFPTVGLLSIGMAAVALGIARAAIDELVRLAAAKNPFGMQSSLATRPSAQIAICEATAAVGAGRALLAEQTRRIWESVNRGEPVEPADVGQLRIAATHGVAVAVGVVDRMYTTAGSTALFTASALQRGLRDVHAITQHHFVAPPSYEMVGKILLGVETDGFML